MKEERTEYYRKNKDDELWLQKLNDTLVDLEKETSDHLEQDTHACYFVVGTQRSGTTLLHQWMINNFDLSYVSNYMARFWKAPLAGKKLFDIMHPARPEVSYTSDLGYTSELIGPHEFGYFWKQWFGESKTASLDALTEKLNKLTSLTHNPWIFKNLHYVAFNINEISKIKSDACFIYIKRNLLDTAVSTYKARVKLFGSAQAWFGLKPFSMETLKHRDVFDQIILQIYESTQKIEKQLAELKQDKYIAIEFESFKADPEKTAIELKNQFSLETKRDRFDDGFIDKDKQSEGESELHIKFKDRIKELRQKGEIS